MKERLTQAETLAAYERIRQFNAAHPVGCCLHIVLSDGNVEDHSVASCRDLAIERNHPDCVEVAELMLRMSRTQRNKAYRTC